MIRNREDGHRLTVPHEGRLRTAAQQRPFLRRGTTCGPAPHEKRGKRYMGPSSRRAMAPHSPWAAAMPPAVKNALPVRPAAFGPGSPEPAARGPLAHSPWAKGSACVSPGPVLPRPGKALHCSALGGSFQLPSKGEGQRCIGTEGASEAAPEVVRQAVGGGCQSGWGRFPKRVGAVTVGYKCR